MPAPTKQQIAIYLEAKEYGFGQDCPEGDPRKPIFEMLNHVMALNAAGLLPIFQLPNQEGRDQMTVRAKFYVTSIQHHHTNQPEAVCAEVKLAPVYGDDNKPWSAATPQGRIEMTITNPEAIDGFELGRKYLVDFAPAE